MWAATGVALAAAFVAASAQTTGGDRIAIQVNRPGGAIQPTMFGIFFEDINFAADGGLYPERVKNRSFEFTEPLSAWTKLEQHGAQGELVVRTEGALNENNPHYLRLRIYDPAAGYGVTNSGFRGMGVEAGAAYIFSAYVRVPGSGPRTLRATLVDENGKAIGDASLSGFGDQWKKYEAVLRPAATSQRARLNVFAEEKGEIDLDMVSLFPKDTWKNRPNGLRPRPRAELLAGPEARLPPLPRRLHRRRPAARDALPVEEDDRRCERTQVHRQPLERRVRPQAGARTTSSRSASASSSTSSWPRTSARALCRSSTAAWPASSTPARPRRSTSSTRTSRTRST